MTAGMQTLQQEALHLARSPQITQDSAYSVYAVLLSLSSGHGLDKQQWNALIGIVTAIVGNVLISFALNLQRYAHIRINRELQSSKSSRSSSANGQYATQIEIAEERSELNAKAPGVGHGQETDEETSLMNGDGKKRRGSEDSDETVKPRRQPSEDEEDCEDDKQKKNYLKSPWWWAGIILMTIGEAGNFLAYGFAPASLVSPLGVVALISNCVIAPWLLKEKFRKQDALGVLIAVGGVVTLVLSSTGQEKRMGPDDIWGEITRWEFELYLGLTAGAMVILMWASERYGDRTLLIDLGLVGLFGGYTALSTKGIASMLSDTLWKAVTFPITYLLLFTLVGTALMQIRYLNRALSRFDSTQVIPTQFVMFTISVILGSAVLYRDFESADGERVGKFVGGCAMTFLGVYFITSGRHSNDGTRRYDSDDDEDEEQRIGLLDEEDDREDLSYQQNIDKPQSRRESERLDSRIVRLERVASDASQPSSPFTPTSMNSESSDDDTPWAATRDHPQRTHSNYTSTSAITDSSEGLRLTGTTPSKRDRLSTTSERKHRRSIADLFPGPISTPLSSSLSGVIADRRRELEAVPAKLRRLGVRKSKSSRSTVTESGGDGNGLRRNPPSAPVPTLDDIGASDTDTTVEADSSSQRPRSLSLSQSLGGLFGGRRKKSTQDQTRPDSRGV